MHDKIVSVLHELEKQQDFKVLFAAESGSRAWGFASPDSDYDIRAIYVKPESWYWSLDAKQTDNFTAMLPDEMDISAWELRKALRLFAGCNPSLNEWLGTSIMYYADPLFAKELRDLIPMYFNPIKTVHHYLALSANAMDDYQSDGTMAVKKIFYALRGLLAAIWAAEKQTMPPTPFKDLLVSEFVPPDILAEIALLQEIKACSTEKTRVPLPNVLHSFFRTQREMVLQVTGRIKHTSASLDALNNLFYRMTHCG